MTTLKNIERAARRLRSAEALVQDLRLALKQEIELAIDTADIPIHELARVAGPSRRSRIAASAALRDAPHSCTQGAPRS